MVMLSCMLSFKPLIFQAKQKWESQQKCNSRP
uniref:Uncharacterized protein n=1 Tax=Anguilla anguilla TaxID=7936 RepID=A0A0E9SI94_ANGAN